MGLALDPSHWGLLILTGAFIGLGFGLFGRAGELAIAPPFLLSCRCAASRRRRFQSSRRQPPSPS